MGKVRRGRRKLHVSAVKDKRVEQRDDEDDVEIDGEVGETESPGKTLVLPPLSENPFSAIKISQTDLNQSLDLNNNEIPLTDEVEKTEEETTGKEVRLNKKEKRKQRRENFIKKLSAAKVEIEKKNAARKRAKAPVVGDLRPMTLALPDIEKIINESQETTTKTKKKKRRKPRRLRGQNNAEDIKSYNKPGIKSKRRQMLCEIDRMKKLISDPSFKKNAEKTIDELIQNNIAKLKET